jgi:hypothetical protein
MSPAQTFPSAADAMATVRAGLRFLAAADATQMPVQTQAEGEISESFARTVCLWTDKLPEDSPDTADRILVGAATAGMDLRGLAELAGEMDARSRPDTPDRDPAGEFDDRSVRLETTFGGAGVMNGDLTPECAAVVTEVLDALSAPAGAEDTRTYAQRYHDALQEAMRRLVASGLLPERAGQPAKESAHISLADLLMLDGSSALQQQWTAEVRAQWAAHRAAATVGASDGAAWLEGDAARAFAWDAAVTPVVLGEVNYPVMDDLVRLCAELARLNHAEAASPEEEPQPPALRVREALEQQIIGKTTIVLLHSPIAPELRRLYRKRSMLMGSLVSRPARAEHPSLA